MGFGRGFSRTALVAAAIACAGAGSAQFSDSFSFLKAVKDADGAKAMDYLNKPGQPALNARDPGTGETALHIVIKRHDTQWLSFLLGRGANFDIKDTQGNTPLMTAAQLSDVDSARLLLQVGARVNMVNSSGETPLIAAVQRRDLAMVRLLIANGADPRIADTLAGKSARDYAQEDARGAAVLKILDDAHPKPSAAIAGPVRH